MIVLTKGEMFDLLSDHLGIFEVDEKSGVINWASKTLEIMFGYTISSELEGESVDMLLPANLRAKHAATHRPYFSVHPEPRLMGRKMDLQGQRKDGSVFRVEVMLLPRVANRTRVIVGIVFDMTQRA